jgi:hypothetical protein
MALSPEGTYYDDNELDGLFKAVGFAVIQWGQAEQSLDLATGLLYNELGGKPLAKRLPKMLETKLELIETCLIRLPILARLRTEGRVLVADFRRLSAMRHQIIHGAVSSVSAKDGGFEFMKLDIKDDEHVVRDFRFDGQEFPKLTKDLIDLGANTIKFAGRLWEIVRK